MYSKMYHLLLAGSLFAAFSLSQHFSFVAIETSAGRSAAIADQPTVLQQRVLIDIGGVPNYGGTLTSSPNINGNYWNQLTDGRPGIRLSNAITANNQNSGLGIEVINRLDGTYALTGPGMGNGNTAGVVGDYPASATTDHQLIHVSATNGQWKLFGMQPSKTYSVKFWGTRSNTTAARNAEIKRNDETVWKSYSATANTNYNNAAVFSITGKTEMIFDIRTKAGSDFSALNVIDITYDDSTTTPPPPVNLVPIARAGADTTIQLPRDSVSLRGCLSSDPENAPLKYKWRKISGPATYLLPVDSLCSVTVKSLVSGVYSFELTVTDTGGLAAKDSISISVNSIITTNWPPQVTPICNRPYKIVVVGSSTSYGTGANPIDSSWVNKFKGYLFVQNQQVQVVNIATLSLTSWDVSPTGTPVPAPYIIDTLRNITKALSYSPDAIILNLPSNDVARGISTSDIHTNMLRISALADAANVPIWVTTTQPRDGISPAERQLQMDLRDWINTTYGNRSVDFWTTVANADGTINSFYAAGDGVHLNNYGHHVLFTRIVAEKIWDSICIRNTVVTPNLAPVARAGADTTIQLPIDSVSLRGCLSSDPEGAALRYKWRKISGPATYQLLVDTLCTVKAKSLVPGAYSFELTVTDPAGLTGKDSVTITVNAAITTNWPPQATPLCNRPYKIVVVGSSTSYGTGANPIDSSWVNKFKGYLFVQNQQVQVINIATLSLTSWDVSPTGTPVPAPYVIDTLRNITKALSYNPDAIILNLPSNDVARGISTSDIHTNMLRISELADAANVPIWVTTTQPRDGISPAERQLQMDLRDWINTTYGNRSVDFWTTVANADGTINSFYGAGDGVHLNNYGHHVLFTRIVAEKIWDTICIRHINITPNQPPHANAGSDIVLAQMTDSVQLNGSSSFDPDGNITKYKWRKISGPAAVIVKDSVANAWIKPAATGTFFFELTVTDDSLANAKDTVSLFINAAPVARAGADLNLMMPGATAPVNGSASSDPDGVITKYRWKKISGASATINDTTAIQTNISFSAAGLYSIELAVTDNYGIISRDTIVVTVNAAANNPPVANAGPDQAISIPLNVTILTAAGSTDSDGSIASYRWRRLSGLNSVIADSTVVQTFVSFATTGQFLFELIVTDNEGATGKDTVMVTIIAAANNAPVANAGADQAITLPTNLATLNGNASADADGTIVSYRWKRLSGINSVVADSTASVTFVSFAGAGQYFFELTVTDNQGATGKDTVKITVNTAVNTAPVANAGADQAITLPTNLATLNGNASADADGTIISYRWKRLSGTNSIVADSNASVTFVSFAGAGQYFFELTVTDNQGATGKDTVKITVNPAVNTAPVANAGADQSLQLPANRVFVDGRNSYDAETVLSNFSWQYISGPTGSLIATPLKDTSSIIFVNAGTYTFRLTVTDAGGLSASDDIVINLLPPANGTRKIKVNIYGGSNPFTNAEWNNWNIAAGVNSPSFLYDNGQPANVTALVNESALIADNGTGYAATASVCPPQVLRYNSANTARRTLTLSGFDPAKQYSLEFYASRANTGNSTEYAIGNRLDTISTSSNVNDYAKFTNITPDNTGKIIVNIRTIGVWNYIAGFMVTEQTTLSARNAANTLPDKRETLQTISPEAGITELIYPNPAMQEIYLSIPEGLTGRYAVTITNTSGILLIKKTGNKEITASLTEKIWVSSLAKGMYQVNISINGKTLSGKFIKM